MKITHIYIVSIFKALFPSFRIFTMSEPTLVEISSESDYLSQGTQENPINLASENIIESNTSQHSNNSSIRDSKTL